MSTEVYLTRDALSEFAEPSDAVINFTAESIAGSVAAVAFGPDGTASLKQSAAYPVTCENPNVGSLQSLVENGVVRFVIVSDGSQRGERFATQLRAANVPHVVCVLEESCDAEAFMDEEDSEAVAERLRQLGYI